MSAFSGPLVATLSRYASSWSAQVPPHSYALLRIVLGAVGLLSLAGLTPVSMFWDLAGLSPLSSDGVGPRAWLYIHGWGGVVGWAFFVGLALALAAVSVGYRTGPAVLASFIGLVAQPHWNHLPLSSAHAVLIVLFFCLLWAEPGRVWSLDAKRSPSKDGLVPVWPLMLMRYQIALIYWSSALWKISFPEWRDGSVIYWVLSLNGFHRFPGELPLGLAPVLALMTWGTLGFEFAFPFLVFARRTRLAALVCGVALHLGLWATLELGPFSLVMIGSYLAFLNPQSVSKLGSDAAAPTLRSLVG